MYKKFNLIATKLQEPNNQEFWFSGNKMYFGGPEDPSRGIAYTIVITDKNNKTITTSNPNDKLPRLKPSVYNSLINYFNKNNKFPKNIKLKVDENLNPFIQNEYLDGKLNKTKFTIKDIMNALHKVELKDNKNYSKLFFKLKKQLKNG